MLMDGDITYGTYFLRASFSNWFAGSLYIYVHYTGYIGIGTRRISFVDHSSLISTVLVGSSKNKAECFLKRRQRYGKLPTLMVPSRI
jgi:hypothetical protein